MAAQRSVFIVVTAAVLGGTLAGCSGEDVTEAVLENRIEAAADGEVELDLSEGGIAVETEDGSFTATSGAELPDDFPDELPTPEGALVNVGRVEVDGAVSYTLTYEAAGDVAAATWEAYRAELEVAGFTVQFEATDGSGVMAQANDDTWSVVFSGSSADGLANLGLVVAPLGA